MTLNLSARRRFDAGAAAYLRQDYKKSIQLFTEAIDFGAGFAASYAYRGASHLKLDNFKAALADLDRAIRLDPGYALAYHLRGLTHESLGNLAKAYRDFDRALEIDPECRMAYDGRESVIAGQPAAIRLEDFEIVHHLNILRLNQQTPC